MAGQPDILLDVSRTVSRIGAGGDSGVDRVERAYIRHLIALGGRTRFLTRVLGGVALLDADGMLTLLHMAEAPGELAAPDLLGHLSRRQSPARRRAETAVRQHALEWVRAARAPGLLRQHLAPGFVYLNVGHSNLDDTRLGLVREGGAEQIAVMIHDVIPLDYPEFSRPEAPKRFERLLSAVAHHADLVIFNSADTQKRADRQFAKLGTSKDSVTALLGVDPLTTEPPARTPSEPPSFVVLGTIEPRKNHLLLLSIWRQMTEALPADQVPQLHIIGRRGWENENIVDMLDRAPFMNTCVFEHGYLSDSQLAQHLSAARALLFPSFAEGFGYPLAEACRMGIPAICSDLPVYREFIDTGPIYLDPLDGPGWKKAILSLAQNPGLMNAGWPEDTEMPNWADHFRTVLGRLSVE